MKKWKLASLLLVTMVISFFIGQKTVEKDHFSVWITKSFTTDGSTYLDVKGELSPVDFEPGFKVRNFELKCSREAYGEREVFCGLSELFVFGDLSYPKAYVIKPTDILKWDSEDLIIQIEKNSKFETQIHVDLKGKSLREVERWTNGETKTSVLVSSTDSNGAYHRL